MQNAEKISVSLTPEMVSFIRASVEIGEYASTSEALRDAIRVWQREKLEHAERINSIKARIANSLNDPFPDLSSDDVDAELEALFQKSHIEMSNAHA